MPLKPTITKCIITELNKKTLAKQGLFSDYLSRLKRKASKKYGFPCPTNIELLETYNKMVKNGGVKLNKNIEEILTTKNIRTSSGVAIVAVLTKPYPCPGNCVYCPNEKNMPKSYLSNEPAVMRAILTDFHPYRQVQARIKSLEATGHKTDKIELIVMGGTFSYLPKHYQTWFIKECFRACNEYECNKSLSIPLCKKGENKKGFFNPSLKKGVRGISGQYIAKHTLNNLQKLNEKSNHRIIGLTLETRPDYIDKKEIINMRGLGATRVELGVQSVYDDVLKLNKRGHSRAEIIKATKLLKEAGFKINYHIMPNLPGSSYKKDLEMFKELFFNPDFQPDMLKIYPCVVVRDSQIYKWWRKGKYKPYSDAKLIELLAEIKKTVPYYVRITRIIRDIPATSIIAGNKISNLRQTLMKKSIDDGWQCKCIRCREVRNKNETVRKLSFRAPASLYGVNSGEKSKHLEMAKTKDFSLRSAPFEMTKSKFSDSLQKMVKNLKLFRQDYDASDGKEIFLSFEDSDRKYLYSLLRLRINSQNLFDVVIARSSALSKKHRMTWQSQNLSQPTIFPKIPLAPFVKGGIILPVLQNAAIIREVHTYGQLVPISSKNRKSPQHTGLGKKLIFEAERITVKEFGLKKIAVISGVGVRDYYRKLGYRLKKEYMVKKLKK